MDVHPVKAGGTIVGFPVVPPAISRPMDKVPDEPADKGQDEDEQAAGTGQRFDGYVFHGSPENAI
jgi:hypothetical protein